MAIVTTRHQNVAREWSENVDSPLSTQSHDLVQGHIHRPEKDAGGNGQVSDHGVLAVRQLLDGTDGPVGGRVHEAGIGQRINHYRGVRFGNTLGLQQPLDDVDFGGVRDQPLDVTSTAGLPMLSSNTPSCPVLLPPTIMMGASVVLEAGSPEEVVEASLLIVMVESRFHL